MLGDIDTDQHKRSLQANLRSLPKFPNKIIHCQTNIAWLQVSGIKSLNKTRVTSLQRQYQLGRDRTLGNIDIDQANETNVHLLPK